MRITSVDSVPLGYDVEHREYEYSSGVLTAWNSPLVRVKTDDGYVGWGEVNSAFQNADAVEGVVSRLGSHLLGENPRDTDVLVDQLRSAYLTRRLGESVVGAIEVALHDVVGQAIDTPVYELLGGAETDGSLRSYGSGGLGATVDQRVDQAVEFSNDGFNIVKIRGMPTTDGTLDLIERAIEATGPGVSVAVDDTGNDGLEDILGLIDAMNTYADDIAWFEDPAPSRQDLEAYRQIRDSAAFPVTGMESCVGLHEFETALEYDCVDCIHPDASRGGYHHLDAVSARAASMGVPLILHVWGGVVTLLANAHYAASDPNCRMIEYCRLENALREEFLPRGIERDGDKVVLPETGGLGLALPDDIAETYPYRPNTGHVSFDR